MGIAWSLYAALGKIDIFTILIPVIHSMGSLSYVQIELHDHISKTHNSLCCVSSSGALILKKYASHYILISDYKYDARWYILKVTE